MTAESPQSPSPAGLLPRLLAMVYDGLLVAAALSIATAMLLPFTHGQAIAPHHPAYRAYLLGVWYLFFGWFWTHGGQTLGMRAWRLRVERTDGTSLNWVVVLSRLLAATLSAGCLGLGYAWALIDPKRRTWHDVLTGTRVVRLPKQRGSAPSKVA